MNVHSHAALRWITELLARYRVPYQITGGLAARIYGAKRPLIDIDIDVPNAVIAQILPEVAPYAVYGPARYRDANWDLLLLTLVYQNQIIDLSGADDGRLFNKITQNWQDWPSNFTQAVPHVVQDLHLSIISRDELIAYKSLQGREVDLLDLAAIKV